MMSEPTGVPVSGPHHRGPGTSLVVGGLVGTATVYALAVQTAVGQRLDNSLMDAFSVAGADHQRWAAALPNPYLLLGVCAVLALLGLLRGARTSLAVVVSVSVLMVSTQVLKPILPRPHLADQWVMDNSLPSGHTGAAAAVGVALLLVLPRLLTPLAATIAVGLTTYMAMVVVMLSYHRPSDVIASVLLAVASLGVGLRVRGRPDGPSAPPRAMRRTPESGH